MRTSFAVSGPTIWLGFYNVKIGRGAVANLIGYVTNRLDRVDLQVTLHMRDVMCYLIIVHSIV